MNHDLSPEQLRFVLEAIERGHKIEAVKRYREATGAGLAESKDAVEAIMASPLAWAPQPPIPHTPHMAVPSGILSPDKQAAIVSLLRNGRKIEAIKLYREETGLGLAESKEAVEALESTGETRSTGPAFEERTPLPEWDPIAEKNKGCFGMIVIFVAVILGLLVW
jgi:ribosomal protein L7/L12